MPVQSRIETIEGQRTLVVERRPPLQQKLDGLLGSLTHVSFRADFYPSGMAASCELRTHRFRRFREGRHLGTDGIVRDLRLEMCADCGAVAVRDISFDTLPGLPIGHRGPNRRDYVIGWYSGARRNQRVYR